jgi:hypothetical protein
MSFARTLSSSIKNMQGGLRDVFSIPIAMLGPFFPALLNGCSYDMLLQAFNRCLKHMQSLVAEMRCLRGILTWWRTARVHAHSVDKIENRSTASAA